MTIADFLADTRLVLGRVDRGQIRTMQGYLSRLRMRGGRLYVDPYNPDLSNLFTRAGHPTLTPRGISLLTRNDAVLYLPDSPDTPITWTDPVTLAIVGADGGDIVRQVGCSIVIPSFDTHIIQSLQTVLIHCLTRRS